MPLLTDLVVDWAVKLQHKQTKLLYLNELCYKEGNVNGEFILLIHLALSGISMLRSFSTANA